VHVQLAPVRIGQLSERLLVAPPRQCERPLVQHGFLASSAAITTKDTTRA
jgi:hypothetical protein